MVHVSENVDPVLRVAPGLTGYAVDDSGSPGRCGDFARIQGVQREGVVRLIARAICHGGAGSQPEIPGGCSLEPPLHGEGRHQLWN